MQTIEAISDLLSIGRLCEIHQVLPSKVERAATAAGISPVLKLNGTPFYSAVAAEHIAVQLTSKTPREKTMRQRSTVFQIDPNGRAWAGNLSMQTHFSFGQNDLEGDARLEELQVGSIVEYERETTDTRLRVWLAKPVETLENENLVATEDHLDRV